MGHDASSKRQSNARLGRRQFPIGCDQVTGRYGYGVRQFEGRLRQLGCQGVSVPM
jgi:hypothetical protein